MAATDYERTQLKKSLREMGLPQKISYFFSYYTIHFILAVLAVVIITASIVHSLTRKEVLLYFALTNTAIGSELESELTDAFLSASGLTAGKMRSNSTKSSISQTIPPRKTTNMPTLPP